jgi:hypothetical protein
MQCFIPRRHYLVWFAIILFAPTPFVHPQSASPPDIFRVKYISDGAIYLDAGHNAGLEGGMILHLVHPDPGGSTTEAVRYRSGDPVADLKVFSVAASSSACEIVSAKEEVQVGDLAYLAPGSSQQRDTHQNEREATNYPVVVTFSYGDPLDEEIRETRETTVAHTHSSLLDRHVHGRIGVDYNGIREPEGLSSTMMGLVLQADMTHIGGTHWNFTGYWRGRLNAQSTGGGSAGIPSATLTDLLNRTYHLGLYYQNPDSAITLGVGRLYLPWAPSLSTIDGGYVAHKLTRTITVGLFGGSTPDPTSWSYNANQHIAGTFVNYEHGSLDQQRFSSTAGLAMTSIAWHVAREFAFFENTMSWNRRFSLFNSLQADASRTAPGGAQFNTGVTQSFTTVRFQPVTRLTFNLNHNYFRNLPTFDPALISTGLLDQYLFQGLSWGARVELPYHVSASVDLGRSKTSTDTSQSWNQLYDVALGEIRGTGLRLDLRYSKFNSSFGQGTYKAASVSKTLADNLRIEVQGGRQSLNSLFTSNGGSNFVNSLVDWSFSPRYFMEGGYTWNTGTTLNYQQWNVTLGYRFGSFGNK